MEKVFKFMRYIWVLAVCGFISVSNANDVSNNDNICLRNVRSLKHRAKSITLSWDFHCQNYSARLFKIYYQHQDWLACPDQKIELDPIRQKSGIKEANYSVNSFVIYPLHPYSKYKVTIKAIIYRINDVEGGNSGAEEEILVVNTAQDTPNVRPQSTNNDVVEGKNTLVFNWDPPNLKNCSNFNGKFDGFRYKLVSELTNKVVKHGDIKETRKSRPG